jgi:transglutaminase-like putative cysteine protease
MLKTISARWDKLPRDSRDTLFLLLVIAWVLLPQTGNLPWWCSLLAGAVLLWRGWLAFGSRPLPGKFWLMGLLALTIAATWLTNRTLLGREAGVTLIVVLLTLKTLELRARRDAFVIFFLGFFSMLTNFFYSQSLLTAASMLIGLLGLLTMLVNAHMPAGRPSLFEAARTAGWMALLGAPIMVVLFMLFPRLAPLWGVPSDAMAGRSGLSSSMQVGNIAKLALDDSIAMRIRFEGDRAPPQQDLYFRGPVLSNFDGVEWRPPRAIFASRYGLTPSLVVSGAPINYEVTLEPTSRPWLFVMEAVTERPEVPGYQTSMSADLQWLTNRPVADLIRYKVQSYPVFRHGPEQRVPGLDEFLELPPNFNPRTLALAAQMRSEAGSTPATETLVRNVLNRLRTGGYSYTLEPGIYGQHTADEFWFDRKQGFCEHIASSFVILMRALGVPARVVTGYQGGERNTIDSYWILRQADAHAWTEVWQAGRGWIRVDPTAAVAPGRVGAFQRLAAPQGVVAQTLGSFSPTLLAQMRATWEAINNGWNQRVLNYSQNRQLDLLKNLGFESPSWEDLSYVLIAIVVLASAGGALWAWWERSQHDPWLRLLARARRELAKRGIESPESATPRQLARLVELRYGVQGTGLQGWLMALEQQRYALAAAGRGASLQELRAGWERLSWPVPEQAAA